MNTPDDFEDKLQALAWRGIPNGWRSEILDSCTLADDTPPSWRDLLWPSPFAWGALAALWLLLLGIDAAVQSPIVSMPRSIYRADTARQPPEPLPLLAFYQRQRALLGSNESSQ